ncbi:DNA-binding response regulator [Azospirillum humicireducens]|uniref:Regulatory protein VirG n=1 Tax=Azospirillum humicireducens TaxID=1226968 RepID=A0A160JCN2_9PROT|nr:response regulator [Azospirillum humicireducens]ANC90432.1 DNA-binding response regulator [Azospirillum humicireducens]
MDRTPHLLVVDDDREIRSLVAQFLTKHGFRVTGVRDGAEMMRTLDGARVDLIVLDLMLPGEDGLSLCRRLRATPQTAQTPVIMLTAMGEETDRIVGLEMGADDYLAKPFSPRELLARIKAVLRRVSAPPVAGAPAAAGTVLRFEGWSLDVTKRELRSPDGVLVQLSAGEYDLLVAFVEHPQRVLTRDQLLDLARGRSAVPFDRSIDVQVSRLRRKIEPDPADPTLIKTVRGGGYLFTATVANGGVSNGGLAP